MDELDQLLGALTVAVDGIEDLPPPSLEFGNISAINSPDFSRASKNPIFQTRSRSNTTTRSRSSSFVSNLPQGHQIIQGPQAAATKRQASAFSFQLSQTQLLPDSLESVASGLEGDGLRLKDAHQGQRMTDSNETVVAGSNGSIDGGLDSSKNQSSSDQDLSNKSKPRPQTSLPPSRQAASSPSPPKLIETLASLENLASSNTEDQFSEKPIAPPSIRSTAAALKSNSAPGAKPISAFGPKPSASPAIALHPIRQPSASAIFDDDALGEVQSHPNQLQHQEHHAGSHSPLFPRRRRTSSAASTKRFAGTGTAAGSGLGGLPTAAAAAPLCDVCSEPIPLGSTIVRAMGGRCFHPEHFVCSDIMCRKPILASTFVERDGKPFCENCFHRLFSPKCEYCSEPIVDRCINAMNKTFHPEHFFCSQCGNVLGPGQPFLEEGGKAYCPEDYANLFAVPCGRCRRPLLEDFVSACGQSFHIGCFKCSAHECHVQLSPVGFFQLDDAPLCETHYHARREAICSTCHRIILGVCVNALGGNRYHKGCFVCTFCKKGLDDGSSSSTSLSGEKFKARNGKPYCCACHGAAFGVSDFE
ncbi:hypothetical protein HDU97_007063 [Phlyctochytrium planicorne]|nr:hypothetical protein HDU97_007063 [Phlyctochytrium planicorne]